MGVWTDAAVIAAFAGAGLAAFAGGIRYYVEMRRERRKALNRVLWCQLDLWYELSRYDLGGALNAVMPRVARQLGVAEAELAPFDQREMMAELIAENIMPESGSDLDQKYAASVEELAYYEPVLAHRLSGKTALQRHREQVSSLMAALGERMPMDSAADPAVIRSFVSFFQNEMLRTVKSILQKDLHAVGKHLDWKTRRQMKRAMTSLQERLEEDPELPIEHGANRMLLWAQNEAILRTLEHSSVDVPSGEKS